MKFLSLLLKAFDAKDFYLKANNLKYLTNLLKSSIILIYEKENNVMKVIGLSGGSGSGKELFLYYGGGALFLQS